LPLYSLASAWDPNADATGQKDLDGLHFCDLPWMLNPPDAAQTALYGTQGRPAAGYDRLYAFGADAWTLIKQWQAVDDGEILRLRSGQIEAGPGHHLHRIPSCAEIRNGNVTVVLPPDPPHRP
jgi:outer membrane PBP1 activator LpoA protein